jgi:RNA polymerase sigma factor (sigma-70 family)
MGRVGSPVRRLRGSPYSSVGCHLFRRHHHHTQMSEPIADAELVERSRRRDAAAFGLLVERHQPLVFGVALARCHDPALAEDVAQDAFVAAWRDLERLRDVDRVGSWVAGIARNLASSAMRDRARTRELEPQEPERGVRTPEDEAIEREDRELLARALADVPEAHREALVLYYMEGESIASIAAGLGIREDLVKQRLSRGRRALRQSVATRVESALTRARVRPAFRIGVVAALSAAGTRKAAAGSAAGKAIAIMTTKQITVAVVAVLAVVGCAIWRGTRAHPDQITSPNANAASDRGVATDISVPPTLPRPRVQRLADPTARPALLDAIRKEHVRRAAASGNSNSATGAAPALPEADLDREYIRAAVRELIPLLSDCYSEGLTRDPELAGKIVVDFTIEGEPGVGGIVGESAIDAAHSDLPDPAVRECIQETMHAIQIDPPASGGVVRVHYPFAFAPDGPPPEEQPSH